MNRPLTRKEWLAYLDQAIKEFDWEAAYNDEQQAEPDRGVYWKCVRCQYAHIEDECPHCGFNTRAEFKFPPPRQPLTDEELKPICDEYRILFGDWVHDFARAIEAKLKERNT